MRAVEWVFMCDENHQWTALENQEGVEPVAQRCPVDGLEPVTARRMPWVHEAEFLLVPATQLIDSVTGKTMRGGEYFIEILDSAGGLVAKSVQSWQLDRVAQRIQALDSASLDDVLKRARRMGFELIENPL